MMMSDDPAPRSRASSIETTPSAERRRVGADVTAKKQAGKSHKESEQQARTEAAIRGSQLEAVFEAAADGIVIYDSTGGMVQWNAAAADMFEFERMPTYPGLPVATRPARLRIRDEHNRPIAAGQLPSMRAVRGETLTGAHEVDLIITTPSGIDKHISASAAPLRDERGQAIGAVVVYRDVTAQRRLARRTRETLDALLSMAEALVARDVGPEGEETEPAARVTARRIAELTRKVIGGQRVSITAIEPDTELLRPMAAVGLTSDLERIWYAGE